MGVSEKENLDGLLTSLIGLWVFHDPLFALFVSHPSRGKRRDLRKGRIVTNVRMVSHLSFRFPWFSQSLKVQV